jgi:hypothetical protein
MKLINPIEVTKEKITSNVTQIESIWAAGTTYALGSRVVLDTFGATVYESLVASNVGNAPATNTTKWLAVGASNYAAMFDTKNGTQTSNTNTISVTIQTTELINAIGLVNLDASYVRVQMVETVGSTTVYDKTITLKTLPANDWYSFYFGEFIYKDNAVFSDLPPYRNNRITVTITSAATGGIAKVGTLALGKLETIGLAKWGVKLGFADYSRKDTDEFGNYTVIERSYANTMEVNVEVETSLISNIQRLRSQLRAKPVVWVASETYTETTAFGFFSQFDINLSNPIVSNATININGLT